LEQSHHTSQQRGVQIWPVPYRKASPSFVKKYSLFFFYGSPSWSTNEVIAGRWPYSSFCQLFGINTTHQADWVWLEYIIVTPAHHRVQSAINPIILDKN